MKLTREEAVSGHRKMWNWIADWVEEKENSDGIQWLKNKYCTQNNLELRSDCFCCEYTQRNCSACPIQWGGSLEDFMCMQKYEEDDDEGLYALCCNELDWEEQAKLARQIANLPERQDL
ncbi:hypothetical protein [Bacteroides sp.]|uniref:hypothetical protein n=1 Tax=Bacteroides sp. TaxID=29523 RepID=UPI0031FD49B7